MKTKRPYFDQFNLDRLKLELFKKIGWTISNKPDCAKLSDIIFDNGFGQLSESTLYRLFFQFEKHRPYKNTLDILCNFVGFKDSIDFIETIASSREDLHRNGIDTNNVKSKSLVFYCIENTAKNALYDFFEETNEYSEQFKLDLSISLFDSLLTSTKQNWFFKSFANQKYVRQYFFERGHDTKFRIKNYDQAYFSYLDQVKKDKDINNFQDYIFGNCVLFRYYFISKQYDKALKQSSLLYKETINLESYQTQLFIFPYIRYVAYKLWDMELTFFNNLEKENYGYYLLDICKNLKENLGFMEQKILFHTIAETFLYSSLKDSFHWKLKDLYKDDFFNRIPEIIYSKHLKYSLPYFDENGLLHYRP